MHTMCSEMGAHDVFLHLFTKLCCAHAQCGRQLVHEQTNKEYSCEHIFSALLFLCRHRRRRQTVWCRTEVTKNTKFVASFQFSSV